MEAPTRVDAQPAVKLELAKRVSVVRCDEGPTGESTTQVTSSSDGRLHVALWVAHSTDDRVPPATVAAWYQEGELRILYDLVRTDRDPDPQGRIDWACLWFSHIELDLPALPGPVAQVRVFESRSHVAEHWQVDWIDGAWSGRDLRDP